MFTLEVARNFENPDVVLVAGLFLNMELSVSIELAVK